MYVIIGRNSKQKNMMREYLSSEEFANVVNFFSHVHNVLPNELGLTINFENGEYYIVDENKWISAKIKYGF